MPSLLISAKTQAALFINGSFLGVINEHQEKTVPLPLSDQTVIAAQPLRDEFLPLWCLLDGDGEICLRETSARLSKWNDEIYTLFLDFKASPAPTVPIITKEATWGDCFVGICGESLVLENSLGQKTLFCYPAQDFKILNDFFLLTTYNGSVCIANKSLSPIFAPLPACRYTLDSNAVKLSFSPGNMDFITLTETYSLKDMSLISRDFSCAPCKSSYEIIRCFCQAVRLGLNQVAEEFMTPELKADMSFENIKNFLGCFDHCEAVRFVSSPSQNSIALGYQIDKSNYHYMCYEFLLSNTSGAFLIDDIGEL